MVIGYTASSRGAHQRSKHSGTLDATIRLIWTDPPGSRSRIGRGFDPRFASILVSTWVWQAWPSGARDRLALTIDSRPGLGRASDGREPIREAVDRARRAYRAKALPFWAPRTRCGRAAPDLLPGPAAVDTCCSPLGPTAWSMPWVPGCPALRWFHRLYFPLQTALVLAVTNLRPFLDAPSFSTSPFPAVLHTFSDAWPSPGCCFLPL